MIEYFNVYAGHIKSFKKLQQNEFKININENGRTLSAKLIN